MAINYKWNVKTVDVKNIDGNVDTIYNVHWRLTATDDANTLEDFKGEDSPVFAKVYGTQILDTSDLSNFKPFADLTENDVETWVKAAMGNDKVTEMKTSLASRITEKITPTSMTKTLT